ITEEMTTEEMTTEESTTEEIIIVANRALEGEYESDNEPASYDNIPERYEPYYAPSESGSIAEPPVKVEEPEVPKEPTLIEKFKEVFINVVTEVNWLWLVILAIGALYIRKKLKKKRKKRQEEKDYDDIE
ncbi:MAG: hypothetical protein IJZ36_00855, partial [Bacilli bacterium]|nr:hypothetical protein [Bacilli bacterium]